MTEAKEYRASASYTNDTSTPNEIVTQAENGAHYSIYCIYMDGLPRLDSTTPPLNCGYQTRPTVVRPCAITSHETAVPYTKQSKSLSFCRVICNLRP